MKLLGPGGFVEVDLSRARMGEEGLLTTPEGTFAVRIARDGDAVWVSCDGVAARFERVRGGAGGAEKEVRAPMTGRVVRVSVAPGTVVAKGDVLVILEAMKMEYRLEAPADGKVAAVSASAGGLVELGQALVTLE